MDGLLPYTILYDKMSETLNSLLETDIKILEYQVNSLQETLEQVVRDNKTLLNAIGELNEQIAALQASNADLTDLQRLMQDRQSLRIGWASGDSPQHVTRSLALPQFGGNGSAVTWMSDQERYVRVDGPTGVVTRPSFREDDAIVTLTATLRLGELEDTFPFLIRVAKEERHGREIAEPDPSRRT